MGDLIRLTKQRFWDWLLKLALVITPIICGGAVSAISWSYNRVTDIDKRVVHIESSRFTSEDSKALIRSIEKLEIQTDRLARVEKRVDEMYTVLVQLANNQKTKGN